MLAPQPQHASFSLDDEEEDFNNDENNPSCISFLQPQNQSFARHSSAFVDITSSIENLPQFHYKQSANFDVSDKLGKSDLEISSTETPGFKRERLLLEIMRNYGEEFK